MAVDTSPKPNGLKVALDTIVAPREAFESIRIAPTWGWAFLIVLVLTLATSYIVTPAVVHGLQSDWPNTVAKNPALSGLSADEQQTRLAVSVKIASFVWVFTPLFVLFGLVIGTVIMVIFNALGRGDGSFGKYWAAQCNIALTNTVGAIVLTAIVFARGADSFTTAASVQEAMPNLGMLVPGVGKLHAFFATFTPFTLWGAALVIVALMVIGRVPRVQAWLAGILAFILPGAIAVAFTP
jgi:Yip1 domain